jgi:hypothetical protein
MKKTQAFLLFFMICSNMLFAIGLKKIRGVELQVVDIETGNPLPNISVYYYLTKSKINFNVSVPGDVLEVVIEKKRLFTDEKGIVHIKKRFVFLGLLQTLENECFYINIDTDKEEQDPDKKYYFSRYFIIDRSDDIIFPTQEYYPAVVYNVYNSLDGYVVLQEARDLKVKQDKTVSDLMEKENIKIIIGLKKLEQPNQVKND